MDTLHWQRKINASFLKDWSFVVAFKTNLLYYRVSHSKEGKVILLWWGFRFWFLLTFLVLHVHEKGTFLLNSSVFIFLMFRALYRMICKNAKSFFGKNTLNVSNVKLFSKKNFIHNFCCWPPPMWCLQSKKPKVWMYQM